MELNNIESRRKFAAELTVKIFPNCQGGTTAIQLQEAIRLARVIMVSLFGEDWNKDTE